MCGDVLSCTGIYCHVWCAVNFARVVPSGLLVFFPSYPVMEKCVENWQVSATDRRNCQDTALVPQKMHPPFKANGQRMQCQ